jgi:hypothetical protein
VREPTFRDPPASPMPSGPPPSPIAGTPGPVADAPMTGAAVVADVARCGFCEAPAEGVCPRCATFYCAAHGDRACDACAAPVTGLPSPLVVRAAAVAFVVGVVVAVWLLVAPPRLPGEEPPPPGAGPAVPAATAAAGRVTASPRPVATGLPATATPARQTHIVRSGDTLGQIAAQYGTTVDALRAANPGINENLLQVGQELVIPAGR